MPIRFKNSRQHRDSRSTAVPATRAPWSGCLLLLRMVGMVAMAPAAMAQDNARRPELTLEPFTLATRAHGEIKAELGTLRVPRLQEHAAGPSLTLRFVRLKAVAPSGAAPVIYLAGGPGGSGIDAARGVRWPVFDAVRQHTDVILLDQRGTGRSEPPPPCPRSAQPIFPLDRVLTPNDAMAALKAEASRCVGAWRAQGVDLAAFTTVESAHDVEAVRQAIGAPQVSLWGMSYGTHLALAVLRAHPTRVARVVLMGTEGPDHTLKTPLEADRLIDRLHRWAGRDRAAQVHTRDLWFVLRRAIARLEREPLFVRIPGAPPEAPPMKLGAFDLQLVVAAMIGRTQTSSILPVMLGALHRGDASLFAQFAWQVREQLGRFSAMSLTMDVASGATPSRRALVHAEEQRSVLGVALNFPWTSLGEDLGLPDLGETFRAPVTSEVPTLFVSGTMDGRTPVSNAREVMQGFRRATHLILDQAGHDDDLWISSSTIAERIARFLAGASVRGGTLRTKMLRIPRRPPGA
jgi:pimeloyl-ACP methyl ester carboxylesterase